MVILALDQGSTKTVAILMDTDGNICGKGVGAGACHFFDGMPKAMSAAQAAAQGALAQAGIGVGDVDYICSGMAGANFPEEIAALEAALVDLFHVQNVKVYNDCLPALRAGSSSLTSGVICAGTGLNAAIRSPHGVLVIYNNYVDDLDQGAGALGRRTLQAIFMAEIGFLPATLLTARVLAAFDLESVDGLLLAYQRGRLSRPLKDICPILFATASQGDEVARNVISTFARDVSRYMLAGIRKYQLQETEIEIVLSGGVFKARSSLLLNTIASEIHQVAPKARMIEALYEPVVGAALLVLDEILGRPLPEAVMANCLTSAEKMELKRF